MSILNALKGIGGEFELNRVIGAFGGIVYTIAAPAFVAYELIAKERTFDLVAFCTAFPAGLAVIVGATAGAVALKDRNVAVAKAKEAETAATVAQTEGSA